VRIHSDRATVEAEKAVLSEFRLRFAKHEPWTGPILLRFTAVFPITTEFTKAQREAAARGELYHTAKPDKDNVEKLVVDALNGHAFVDDAQVQGGGVKRYGSPPRLDVVLERLSPVGPPSPADKRAQARLAEHLAGTRPLGVKAVRTKSGSAAPPQRLKAAIDAAIAREGRRK
jgi:Holliday junction resolvase RusA-like endonuclease